MMVVDQVTEQSADIGLRPICNCVIFGGTGFIGTHFARFLLSNRLAHNIILADIEAPNKGLWSNSTRTELSDERVRYVPVDVCSPIQHSDLPKHSDLILNLAAVHREPGHQPHEYFEKNLHGAKNVCSWATEVDCKTLLFTSSISPYGPSEKVKNEDSTPVPVTAYGASKLAAEKIHLEWQKCDMNRKLVVVRPGVVFGPGEGGNVTRLVHSIIKGYFFYVGNENTRKAGGYVKELCHAMWWVLQWQQRHQQHVTLFNFSMDPSNTLKEYVNAVCLTAKIRRVPLKIPYPLLLGASYPIAQIARLFGISQPIEPLRIQKLVRSNNIEPGFLKNVGYPYQYSLEQALADWKYEKPEDWC